MKIWKVPSQEGARRRSQNFHGLIDPRLLSCLTASWRASKSSVWSIIQPLCASSASSASRPSLFSRLFMAATFAVETGGSETIFGWNIILRWALFRISTSFPPSGKDAEKAKRLFRRRWKDEKFIYWGTCSLSMKHPAVKAEANSSKKETFVLLVESKRILIFPNNSKWFIIVFSVRGWFSVFFLPPLDNYFHAQEEARMEFLHEKFLSEIKSAPCSGKANLWHSRQWIIFGFSKQDFPRPRHVEAKIKIFSPALALLMEVWLRSFKWIQDNSLAGAGNFEEKLLNLIKEIT